MPPHTGARRSERQALHDHLTAHIDALDQHVKTQAEGRPQTRRLMTHPGVGPVTALATEVFLGDPARFPDGKAVASYIGLIPSEYSSGDRQRRGRLTKQGNPMLRFLWCEAAIHAARRDPTLARFYRRKLQQKGLGKARVAVARKLGIRLWVLLREQIDYAEFCRRTPARAAHGEAWTRGSLCGDVVAVVTGKMNRLPASREREFARVIMVRCDRRDVWWAPPERTGNQARERWGVDIVKRHRPSHARLRHLLAV